MTNDVTSGIPLRVWRIDTDRAPDCSDLAIVDCAERERGHGYARASDRNAFLKTRAALRRLLGRIIGADPRAIQFEKNVWGKPMVAGKRARPISFSVSHTDGLSIIAVSDGRRIGVDVERERSVSERNRIAGNVFGASIARALAGLQDAVQDRAFLQLWTAAEAFVKANGTGFAGHGARIPVALSDSSGSVQLEQAWPSAHKVRLSLRQLSLPHGYLGSLVIEGRQENEEWVVPELV